MVKPGFKNYALTIINLSPWFGMNRVNYENIEFVDDRLHGVSKTWSDKGKLRSETHNMNGVEHGTNKCWDET